MPYFEDIYPEFRYRMREILSEFADRRDEPTYLDGTIHRVIEEFSRAFAAISDHLNVPTYHFYNHHGGSYWVPARHVAEVIERSFSLDEVLHRLFHLFESHAREIEWRTHEIRSEQRALYRHNEQKDPRSLSVSITAHLERLDQSIGLPIFMTIISITYVLFFVTLIYIGISLSAFFEKYYPSDQITQINVTAVDQNLTPVNEQTGDVAESSWWNIIYQYILPALAIILLTALAFAIVAYIASSAKKISKDISSIDFTRRFSIFSVLSSLIGCVVGVAKYWSVIYESSAFHFLILSCVMSILVCLSFLFLKSRIAVVGSFATPLIAAVVVTLISRAGIEDLWLEFSSAFSEVSIPSGAILFLGICLPLMFSLVVTVRTLIFPLR